MPKCAVCDGEQFYESAGFYYCLICSTQSQDLLRTEAETDFTAQAAFSTRANALRITGGGKAGLDASAADRTDAVDGGLFSRNGEPETLFVLVDVVLRAQVEWLIENAGARPELRDVMKGVWMSFLSEALPDVRAGVPSCLSANNSWTRVLRKSDVCALSNCRSREFTRTLRHFKTLKKSTGNRLAKVKRCSEKAADVHANSVPVIWTRVAPTRLTMNRVIALLMIGLHLSQESTILTSDVLRWIRLLQLPCVDPSDFIPDDQLVTYYQLANSHDAFTVRYHEVEWETSVMISFLKIPTGECPFVPVFPVIQRYVEELNLPSSLIPVILEIASKLDRGAEKLRGTMRKQKDSAQRSDGIECFVMSLIILVLRMLFGLDGVTERKISSRTYDLQQLVQKPELFDIGDWISHVNYRRLLLFTHTTIMRNCSIPMSLRLIEKNMLNERRVLKWQRLRRNLYADENFKDLQYSFQEIKTHKYSAEKYSDVPVTNRPFRAHADSLVERYPSLAVDYSKTSLDHVLSSGEPPVMEEEGAKRCLKLINKAQVEFATRSALVGATNIRLATQQKPCMDLVPSSVLRWLITVCAEMIEQEPTILLGQLMSIEPSFYAIFRK